MRSLICSVLERHPFASAMLVVAAVLAGPGSATAATQQYQYTAACYDCHGSSGDMRPVDSAFRNVTTGGFTGNHRTHLGPATNQNVCEKCHTGSKDYSTGHFNDRIEMSANLNASPATGKYSKASGAQTWFNWTSNQQPLGTCSNINCHFEATTPSWGTTPFTYTSGTVNDCAQCHGAPPSGTTTGTAGSHGKHDAYFKGAAECKKCHVDHVAEGNKFSHATSAGQRNIKVSLHDPTDAASGTYSGSGANFLPSQFSSQSFGSCSTTYCHSDGKGTYATPTWGTASSGQCGTCHGARNDNPPSAPHGTHVGDVKGYHFACAKCHSRTVKPTADSTTFAAISSTHMHVNKAKDVAFDSVNPTGAWNGTTCSATYCHSNASPFGGSNSAVAQAWSGTLDCGGCHSKSGDASPTWSTPHTKHVNAYGTRINCATCHAQTAADGTTLLADKSKHVDGTKTLSFNAFANSAATYNLTNHQCSNVYCHGNGTTNTPTVTVTWSGTLDCNGCHGGNATNPPASAPHAKHVGSASPYRYSCAKCHSRTAKDTADATTFALISSVNLHVNKAKDVAFNTTFVGGSAAWNGTNCSSTYCHSDGKGSSATPGWSGTLACNACHGRGTGNGMPDYASGAAGSATANSHGKHVVGSSISCGECHEKTTKNGSAIRSTTPSYHVNKTASDVFFNLSGNSKNGTYNSGAKTCSTTYCHGTGPSPAWGGSTNCASCHDATNALGGRHDLHYNSATVFWNLTGTNSHTSSGYAYGCKNCHPTNLHANGPATGIHDANIATSGVSKITAYTEGGATLTDAKGFKYSAGTCTSTCHVNGKGGPAVTSVTWNSAAAAGCGACHNKAGDASPGWSTPHTKHVNGYSGNSNFTCNACHAGTAASNTALAAAGRNQHPNGVKDLQFNAFASPNGAATYPDTATGCSNTYCHSPGTSLTAPTHGAIQWTGTMTCGSCHTGGTATGPSYTSGSPKANSHAKHVTSAGITCDKCHYATTTNGTTIADVTKHVNKTYDVTPATGVTFSYTYNAAGGSCSSISCHGNNTATWGGTVNCQDCHTGANDVDNFTLPFTSASQVAILKDGDWTVTGHGKASGSYTSGNPAANFGVEAKECEFCHDAGVGHNASANWFRLKNYSTPDWGRNGPCMICHGQGATGVTVGTTTKSATKKVSAFHYGANHGLTNNGGQFCWDCHDGHGDGNAYMIHSQVAKVSDRATGAPTTLVATAFTPAGTPVWGDYVNSGKTGICQVCHTPSTGTNPVAHFSSDLYDANHNPGTRCTQCHSHNNDDTRTAAFKPGGNCDLCHGYPPVRRGLVAGTYFRQNNYTSAKFEDYSGGGGAHTIERHVPATVKASDGWAPCAVCHSDGNMNPGASHTMQTPVVPSKITIDVKDRRKFDHRRTLGTERYTGTLTDKDGSGKNTNATGSCSNVNCHLQPSKKWSTTR